MNTAADAPLNDGRVFLMQKGQYVRLHTDDDWNGLYGIISDTTDVAIAVFCVGMPSHRYYIWRDGNEARTLELLKL